MKINITGKKKGPSVGGALKLKKKAAEASGFKHDPKGMRCPDCKAPGYLVGVCMIVIEAPLAKGGGIKLGGIPITHATAKASWDEQEKTVVCKKCGVKFIYGQDGLEKVDSE